MPRAYVALLFSASLAEQLVTLHSSSNRLKYISGDPPSSPTSAIAQGAHITPPFNRAACTYMAPSSQLHALLTRQGFANVKNADGSRSKPGHLCSLKSSQTTTAEQRNSLSRPSSAVQQKRGRARPFDSIPLEIVERILSHLPLMDLIRLRRLDRSVSSFAASH